MKNYCSFNGLRITFILVYLSVIASAQDTIMYRGGYQDGYSAIAQANFTPANLNSFVAYQGGGGDGYSSVSGINFTPSVLPGYAAYQGGGQDGYARSELVQFTPGLLSTQAMYLGASGDGYGMTAQSNFIPSLLTHHYMYMGSGDDGYATANYQQFTPGYLGHFSPYAGGPGDGYAGSLIVGVVLPVQLLSFDGRATERGNLLEWSVSFEKDLNSYELQRGGDGIHFTTIHTRDIISHATQKKNYNYLDTEMPEGDNYYRLQLNERNEERSYSNIVLLVHKKNHQMLSIYPNPAQDMIMMQYKLDSKAMMRITDMKGSLIAQQQLQPGENTVHVPVAHLAQGMYMLQVVSETGFDKSIRFMKQ